MEAEEQIRHVVRGLAHWSSLRDHGFELELEKSPGRWRWSFGRCPSRLKVPAEDLIEGIRSLESDPASLAEWAFFVLGSDCVDCFELDETPRNEALREIICELATCESFRRIGDLLTIAHRQLEFSRGGREAGR